MAKAKVAVLISGAGTNMAALLYAAKAADCPYELVLVASNDPAAPGLKIAEAEGETSRYSAIVNEWRTSKEVTSRRLYLETMEEVMRDMNKIIIEEGEGSQGVVPYLPLNELTNRKQGAN